MGDAPTSRLLLACPDQPGLIARVSGFLAESGLNIVDVDQHSSAEGRFFMRMVFDRVPDGEREALELRFAREIGEPLRDGLRVPRDRAARKRVAVMVSPRGPLPLRPALALAQRRPRRRARRASISNHPDHADQVEAVGLPFHHVPVDPATRARGRAAGAGAARRASTCSSSPATCRSSPRTSSRALGAPAINIHHSFLPAFVGADPYHRAYERGVKLIGATAHYVTAELDAGPIIDQDVTRVDHRDEVADMVRLGRDVERLVLARAVMAHLDDRVLLDGDRTIVF